MRVFIIGARRRTPAIVVSGLRCDTDFERHTGFRGIEIGKPAAIGAAAAHLDRHTQSLYRDFAGVAIRNTESEVEDSFPMGVEEFLLRRVSDSGLAKLDLYVRDVGEFVTQGSEALR